MDVREKISTEAMEAALLHQYAGISLPTGFGKCKTALRYCERVFNQLETTISSDFKVLIVAPKLSIFESWKDEMIKWGYNWLVSYVTYSTYISLDKQPLDYDIVILDEVHSVTVGQKQWLTNHPGRILGMSGTFPKYHHSEKGMLIDQFSPMIYDYHTDDAVIDEILNDYRIIVHPLQLSTKKDLWVGKSGGKGWWSSEQLNYEYWTNRVHNARGAKERQIMSIMKMKALMGYKTKEVYAKSLLHGIHDKCLLFANEQAQVDRMVVNTYHSNNPTSEKNLELFKEGKIIKLGACQMLSEGVNIPGLKAAIIMHSFSGGSPKSLQKLGRLLRLNPDEIAVLHFLVFQGTSDSTWLNQVLENLDKTKITWKSNSSLIV